MNILCVWMAGLHVDRGYICHLGNGWKGKWTLRAERCFKLPIFYPFVAHAFNSLSLRCSPHKSHLGDTGWFSVLFVITSAGLFVRMSGIE